MNSIRKVNEINQKELANNVSDDASWHYDYRDTQYIFIGSLHTDLKEEDVIKIFSQYGIPTHINMVKDRDLGKSRGFAYLKYRNFRSCVLAVDNLNGIKILDRLIKVDHVYYKLKDGENEDNYAIDYSEAIATIEEAKDEKKEPKLLDWNPDDELRDPMEAFLKNKRERSPSRDRREGGERHGGHSGDNSTHRSHRERGSRDKERDQDKKRHRTDKDEPRLESHRERGEGHRSSHRINHSHSSHRSHSTTDKTNQDPQDVTKDQNV